MTVKTVLLAAAVCYGSYIAVSLWLWCRDEVRSYVDRRPVSDDPRN